MPKTKSKIKTKASILSTRKIRKTEIKKMIEERVFYLHERPGLPGWGKIKMIGSIGIDEGRFLFELLEKIQRL